MRARVECVACGHTLRPAATDAARCERCAGERLLPECRSCGAQDSNYVAGRCPRCALRETLAQLRQDGEPPAVALLEPYLTALAASPNPWGVLRWMRASQGYETVRQLAAGELEVSHDALDALGRGQAIINSRAALVQHGVLAPRAEQAATFERRMRRALARLPQGEDRAHVQAFGTWQLHHHLLRRERRGETTRSSARYDAQRLRAAVELALWAHAHGLALTDLHQHDLDRWLQQGSSATVRIADFLAWAERGQLIAPLAVPRHRPRRHTHQLASDERLTLIRRLVHDETLDLRDRVGGCLVLLYAQPISRILMLTGDHVACSGQPVTIRLGTDPLELPEPLGQLVARLAAADPNTPWLFPGLRVDAPLSEQHYARRLRRLGITVLPARTGALMRLAVSLPPAILADLLGISESCAANWSQLAGSDWARYAGHGANRYNARA